MSKGVIVKSLLAVLLGSVAFTEEAFAFQEGAITPPLRDSMAQAEDLQHKADSIEAANRASIEAIAAPADTLGLLAHADSLAALHAKNAKKQRTRFVPNPKRALWLALVIPGAGQIYNRKYWKLPIIYGGFLGCTYALMWNQQMYKDYSQAYLDIMDDDPNTKSYENILPPRYNIEGNEEQFKKIFKNKKDYYRRYRDLSAFCFVGVYILSVIDAYVDAQLSEFDISRDLSLQIEPTTISNKTYRHSQSIGLQCNLKF